YGTSAQPGDNDVNTGYRGFLGRVSVLRLPDQYPVGHGPPDQPCVSLAGPYQWVLPSSCSSDPEKDLKALGLSAETISAILAARAPNAAERWTRTSFSYNETGRTRRIWTDMGTVAIVRDTDGRERETVDALGNTTTVEYSAPGFPVHILTV